MEEVSLLLYINRFVRKKQFDVIILDCASTGESLCFISIPATLEWYIKKIFKMERTIARYVRAVAKRVYDVPLPDDGYFTAIEYLFERLRGIDGILVDPQITTVRLITNPEKIVLKETQRAFMYFCLYKMSIDAIMMNRILLDDIKDAYFTDWRESQRQYMEKAEEYFSPIPIFPVRFFKDGVLGYNSSRVLADQIYGVRNPLERSLTGEPYDLFIDNGEYRLIMKLPFVPKKDIELNMFF